MPKAILGLSCFYHDSAAALLVDGNAVAAAQEERFSRIKHDPNFPKQAIQYCLKAANLNLEDLDAIVFYDKPLLKFERLIETYLAYAPQGLLSFSKAIPLWLKEKLFLKSTLKKELSKIKTHKAKQLPPLLFTQHHQSHAASAFFPSPFEKAVVLCLDGVGEWATTSLWLGQDHLLTPCWELNFPHSLGLLYSAFTTYTGFKVNSGEYKLMGLAPYGEPKYIDKILDNLIDLKEDGTFRLNMRYFNYPVGLTMTNKHFHDLFEGPPRKGETNISQKEMDIARSIQVVTEKIVHQLAKTAFLETGITNLCLSGGVALNCVANGKLLKNGPYHNIWIQPAAGDAGGALGAAFSIWHEYYGKKRIGKPFDSMQGGYLGPSFNEKEITDYLNEIGAQYEIIPDSTLLPTLANLLANEKVVGWFQGRMEFGPRALGGRSILGDPKNPNMQSVMNLKIKYRESFRPFAPAVKYDRVQEWFDLNQDSPYMLLVADVAPKQRIPMTEGEEKLFGIDKLNVPRSKIPAITHVDYSARVQTVHPTTNPRFYQLLDHFEALTGCPVLINTSFNVRGEPIVCSPKDAYHCFMRTKMDVLVLENVLLYKENQPHWEENLDWRKEFALD